MDLMELVDIGSGCEDEDCGQATGFLEDCSNQLDCQWEDSMFRLVELVCVTVVCGLLMLLGILGNMLTILVVWLRPHMRSSTYLYLSSMAVSDLLILLLVPLDMYKLWRPRPWPLGDLVCKLTMFLSECCTFSTILHITFLSLERYLAVCWPIAAKTLVTRHRTKALIGCLWLGAIVSAAPVLVMVGVEEVGGEELGMGGWMEEGGQGGITIGGGGEGSGEMAFMEGGIEGVKWGGEEMTGWDGRVEKELNAKIQVQEKADEGGGGEVEMEVKGEGQNKKKEDEGGGGGEEEEETEEWRGRETEGGDKRECRCTSYAASSGLLAAMMILSNLYFLVPLGILGVVYSLIGRTLWLRPRSSRRDQSHGHTIKMLGVIVLVFVLCWLPFHVGRTIFSLTFVTARAYILYYLSQYFNLVSSVLFYLSAAVNPLLYNLMSARYRHAIHSLISYKHHNTAKYLIAITPQGVISFVSKGWGGRTSDKHITENCGFIKKLSPGDVVLADRGFNVRESLCLLSD
ncbi:growth hormone secretagogue receptor type 1-like [Centroberyx affinis]|uniref:growth hormone secretagogue receptor type 1-like n=1 Tax=Centroberyx affinis TaxID=166261 RepID=UPI003A5C014C